MKEQTAPQDREFHQYEAIIEPIPLVHIEEKTAYLTEVGRALGGFLISAVLNSCIMTYFFIYNVVGLIGNILTFVGNVLFFYLGKTDDSGYEPPFPGPETSFCRQILTVTIFPLFSLLVGIYRGIKERHDYDSLIDKTYKFNKLGFFGTLEGSEKDPWNIFSRPQFYTLVEEYEKEYSLKSNSTKSMSNYI